MSPIFDAAQRLKLVTVGGESLSEVELLRLALQQAVGALNGLGGLAHLRHGDILGLSAVNGLPRRLATDWERLGPDQMKLAPVQAVREHRAVWLPFDSHVSDLEALHNTLVVSIPLNDGARPRGVLSVISGTGPPSDDQLKFLDELSKQTTEYLKRIPSSLSYLGPQWWQEASGSPLEQAMRTVGVSTWEWVVATDELLLDAGAQRLIENVAGISPEEWDGKLETWMEHVHPDDLPGVLRAIEHSVTTGEVYSVEYRVVSKTGRVSWVELRGHPTYADDGTPLRMIGTGWDKTETRLAQNSAVQVLQYMSDAFLVMGEDWDVMYANARAERVFSSSQLLGRSFWDQIPATPQLKARFQEAAAANEPTSADLELDDQVYRLRLVPVRPGFTLYASDVTEERRAEQEAAQRANRLSQLTAALAQALTISDVVKAIADNVLAPMGASGMVLPVFDDGSIRPVGMIGYSEDFQIVLESLGNSLTTTTGWPRSRNTAEFVPTLYELECRYPAMATMARESAKNAWAFLPMLAPGKYIGHLVVSFNESRDFSSEEKNLLIALSGMAAQALERARLYDAEHSRAQQLQKGLLPEALPTLPALTAAARYRPASGQAQVGGDWYDAIPLSAGRVALVIGDVMGHGLSEAITMGRLRAAVATIAGMDYPPNELLAHINDVVSGFENDRFATCLYAIYDSTTGICSIASAGHPPPAVAYPDGSVSYPDLSPGLPLGVAQRPYEATELTLPEGSMLVFYTDGLLESRDGDMKVGMDHLAEVLGSMATSGEFEHACSEHETLALEKLCDSILAIPHKLESYAQRNDDAAMLTVRTHIIPEDDVVSWKLPDEPLAASQARRHVREQLTHWGLSELIPSTELTVSELVSNVIRHAAGPITMRMILNTVLTCEVNDGSEATPRIRHASVMDESGRGLQLVAAMTHRWGTRYTAAGKCIWTEQALPENFRQP